MSATPRKNLTLKVDALARVEGEGGMTVRVRNGEVSSVELRIYEPPRFFEAFLRDRRFTEAPDLTARICGICPVAYQMSACHAMEDACGVTVGEPWRALRRLLYCGEWLESHVLHMFMLHAPDFLGYESAIHLSADHPEVVSRALRMKKAGNSLVDVLGGRSVHPVNVRVGGFYRAPTRREFEALREELEWGLEASEQALRDLAAFDYPNFEMPYEFVALSHPDEYPLNEGRLLSTAGLDIPIAEYNDHFEEIHVPHSNALHSRLDGRLYHVGPLARYNLNFDRLTPRCQEAAREAGLKEECRNPFQSLLVRGVEVIYSFEEALRIIDAYEMPDEPAVEVMPRAGVGHGCTEAPRGILYHRYQLDDDGLIQDAQIVPPTSQNQATIEADLESFVAQYLQLPKDELTLRCEQAIRNYDPCISCATHFLKLDIVHEEG